jgi:sterol desaturase/sphingolipid hydroxylase (fatty acid hydroxylase superfamily)
LGGNIRASFFNKPLPVDYFIQGKIGAIRSSKEALMNNTILFFDTTFLLTLVFVLLRTMYLRSKRKELLKKYKKGSYLYEQYVKIMSGRRLVVVLILAILTLLKTIFDISDTLGAPGEDEMLFTFMLGIIGFSIVLSLIYYLHKKNVTEEK